MLKEISIEIIRKCPNRCIHCSSLSSEDCVEIIPLEKFKEVVDGVKKLGLKTICFSGGEPFLHPDIIEMVQYVYSKGLQCYIYSSGIYMDSKKNRSSIPEKILAKIQGKVTKIIFNMESTDECTYNLIMGTQGCMGFLEQSIKSATNRGIVVEGHFVPMKLNQNQIEDMVEFCERLGFSKVSFLRLVMHGRALNNKDRLLLSDEEMKNIEERLEKLSRNKPSFIRIGVPLFGETKEIHCEAANGKLNIRYDGSVYPCEVFKNNRISILNEVKPDNIFEKAIEDIYSNSAYLKNVRCLVEKFSCGNCCENCVGQYYMSLKKQEEKDG